MNARPGRPVPDSVLAIQAATAAADHYPAGPRNARHTVIFRWGTADERDGLDVAEFLSDTAMHIPRTGDSLRLHGISVRVVDVTTHYDIQPDGTHTVYAAVDITPLGPARR
ncbi:hypothetical protein [Streptomyces sp. NBC_01207]|uniref:hypothetical protein n=1 Tax=Streptomyces sp. NBC_01207 TaxID=2903772 RepID=UPI002E13748D|nr:hypothetical protein OG457_27205 [Streptomyces sp. NBC_01207]